ncbi:MAG TPA: glycosyltransferase [Tepidisphaeraceae bacterium]|nr:glycosyltransferase [Tepidisphaeraceae bacterium]
MADSNSLARWFHGYTGGFEKDMRTLTSITLWLLAILIAVAFDESVARNMRDSGLEAWIEADAGLREFLKIPGEFVSLVICAVLIGLFHPARWRGTLLILAASTVSGLNWALKWAVGRHRPFTGPAGLTKDLTPFDFSYFRGGWDGLLVSANLSFPSGHATLSFALASALTMLFPRGRWVFYSIAGLAAVERVWENAHWLSDVVVGAALGIAGVHLVSAVTGRLGLKVRAMQTASEQESEISHASARHPAAVGQFAGDSTAPFLTLVIPAYNEQENIPTLLSRVGEALAALNRPFEVIIVDDGSTDATPRLLAEAAAQFPWLRVLRMAHNGGQSAAFEAGFDAARGELIATIDADLQNDPEEIPRIVPLLDEKNVDMVTGWRKERQDTPFRRWQSRQANWIRNWISQETVHDSASSLKVYRAHAVKGMKLFNGAHRFFPTLVKMRGYTCYETPVKHSHRFAGTAKYGFRNRAVRAFIDLLAVRWMKMRVLRYRATEVRREAMLKED